MTIQETIEQLEDLRCDRESFLVSDEDGLIQRDIDAINAAIDALKKVQWIPCGERLPERSMEALICTSDGYIATIDYSAKHQKFNCFVPSTVTKYAFSDVIAWMPLPEPYNLKGSENNGH